MTASRVGLHNANMPDTLLLKAEDLKGLSTAAVTAVATQLLAHIGEQSRHIEAQDKRIDSQAQGIKWRDAKIQSITFQLAKLKAWRFGAKTERMNAQQREIFEETFAADQASLEAQRRLAEKPSILDLKTAQWGNRAFWVDWFG